MLKRNDPIKKQSIIELYKIGYSMNKIHLMIGPDHEYISKVLKESEVEIRPYKFKKVSNEEMEEIMQRIENGEEKQRIAEELGITKSALSKRLKRR